MGLHVFLILVCHCAEFPFTLQVFAGRYFEKRGHFRGSWNEGAVEDLCPPAAGCPILGICPHCTTARAPVRAEAG